MSSQIPLYLPNLLIQPSNQTPHRDQSNLRSVCMAPRASAIKEQGFSEAVAARIDSPHRGLTRSVYRQVDHFLTKWCLGNRVDFRAPPEKSIAGFLMYLFQERKLQPSTIDGYRSLIADELGNSPVNVSKIRISLVSWTVPIETDLRVKGASPPGISPWCCTNWQGSIQTP